MKSTLSAIAMIVGLPLVAVGVVYIFESTRGLLDAPPLPGLSASEAQIFEQVEKERVGSRKTSALSCGLGGAALVGYYCLLTGVRASAIRGLFGLILGTLFGAAFGAAAGLVTKELSDYAISVSLPSSTAWLYISAAFWGLLGLAAGLGTLANGTRQWASIARFSSPFVGAIIVAVLTPIIVSVFLPLDFKGRIPPRTLQESLYVLPIGGLIWGLVTALLLRK